MANITCNLTINDEDGRIDGRTVTISGERAAVLAVIARAAGLEDDGVEVRDNPQSDDGMPRLVVDRSQHEQYTAYLAEVRQTVAGLVRP